MSNTTNDAVPSALEQALRTIDRLKAAMGEEWPFVDNPSGDANRNDMWRHCPECGHWMIGFEEEYNAREHAPNCGRGRFFAALKELDDAE